MKPLINILTRTNNRPNFFKQCKKSIIEQTYNNIRHIVSIDDKKSLKYIGDTEYVMVKKYQGKIIRKKRKPFPYNLYFNKLHKKVTRGWILYMDDDDKFISKNALARIVNHIQSKNDLLLWKVDLKNRIVPEKKYFKKKPVLNHFSTLGFMYHNKYKDKWMYYRGGDFDYISILWNKIPNKIWINKIFTSIQRVEGKGKRKDL